MLRLRKSRRRPGHAPTGRSPCGRESTRAAHSHLPKNGHARQPPSVANPPMDRSAPCTTPTARSGNILGGSTMKYSCEEVASDLRAEQLLPWVPLAENRTTSHWFAEIIKSCGAFEQVTFTYLT